MEKQEEEYFIVSASKNDPDHKPREQLLKEYREKKQLAKQQNLRLNQKNSLNKHQKVSFKNMLRDYPKKTPMRSRNDNNSMASSIKFSNFGSMDKSRNGNNPSELKPTNDISVRSKAKKSKYGSTKKRIFFEKSKSKKKLGISNADTSSRYLGKRATSSVSKSNFSLSLKMSKNRTIKNDSRSNKENSTISGGTYQSRPVKKLKRSDFAKKGRTGKEKKSSRKAMKLKEIFEIFEKNSKGKRLNWKSEFDRYMDLAMTPHMKQRRIMPEKLHPGPLRMKFHNPKFLILYFYFKEEEFKSTNEIKNYFRSNTQSSMCRDYFHKALNRFNARKSLKINYRKSQKSRQEEEKNKVDMFENIMEMSNESKSEKNNEIMIDISSEEEAKDEIKTDEKMFMLSPMVNKEVLLEDESLFLIENGRNELMIHPDMEDEEIATNPLVLKITNPYKISFEQDFEKSKNQLKKFENRKKLTEEILKIKQDYPFLSKDMPFDGSSYFYFGIVDAAVFLRQRYGIMKILKAFRCSKRAIKQGSRDKYHRSVSLEQVLGLEHIIYEPNELEDFLPVDNDTFLVKEYVKKMRKIEDFVKLEKEYSEKKNEEQIEKIIKRFSTAKKILNAQSKDFSTEESLGGVSEAETLEYEEAKDMLVSLGFSEQYL